MDSLSAIGLLVLRAGMGGMMIFGHGWVKLSNYQTMAESFADPIGLGNPTSLILAIAAEFGCSILLVLGLLTRLAAIPLAITMGVALFVVHAADPWQIKELAAVYLTGFVTLILTGPGSISLDHLIWNRGRREHLAADKD